jgi:hypothetical protein
LGHEQQEKVEYSVEVELNAYIVWALERNILTMLKSMTKIKIIIYLSGSFRDTTV